ncbi:hypothetical protein [Clavibacter sp. Sh2088]|uniref:hypothetical protein n=1 Tax=Clavibacter sp. Sh2088 TaxID=3397676 RepID=UPI0039E1ACF5
MLNATHRIPPVAAIAAALLAALTACSAPGIPEDAGPGADGGIATLRTEAPAPAETVDPLFAEYGEPVRQRLDMTDEEAEAAWQPRERCLADHDPAQSSSGGDGASVGVVGDPEKAAEAEAICMRVAPLPPWELDARNPDSRRFAQLIVDCLRAHGVRQVEIADADAFGRISVAFGGETNDPTSVSLGMQHADACTAEASERSAR